MRRLVIAFVIFTLLATFAVAWEDCPYGVVNDPYPGLCRRYIDTNSDGYCDHSQPEPASNIVTPPIDDGDDSTPTDGSAEQVSQDISVSGIYHIIPIAVILSLLYLTTHLLSRKDIIKVADHRRIWNWALLATFLVTGILGIVLAACINYGWDIPFSTKTLFYHVELGIAMTVISVFHVLWHWNYWKGRPECGKEEKKRPKNKRN